VRHASLHHCMVYYPLQIVIALPATGRHCIYLAFLQVHVYGGTTSWLLRRARIERYDDGGTFISQFPIQGGARLLSQKLSCGHEVAQEPRRGAAVHRLLPVSAKHTPTSSRSLCIPHGQSTSSLPSLHQVVEMAASLSKTMMQHPASLLLRSPAHVLL
jgi:hypothetical protein